MIFRTIFAGGLPHSGYIDKNNFNTSKTPGLYQCGGVTNNDVGINFWGIVLIVKSNDYISQLLIGNVFAWRNLGDDGLTWEIQYSDSPNSIK